jgi:formylglycine-generating enzyme required for sulfatase activity
VIRLLVPLVSLSLTLGCVIGKDTVREAPGSLKDPDQMVKLPGGKFQMGFDQGDADEFPEHEVELGAYLMDRTEVTNAMWRECASANACPEAPHADDEVLGRARHPVVGITHRQAARYCRWVGKRLPSEAEWEFAARAPSFSYYPWAKAFEVSRANGREDVDGHAKTAPVGSFPTGHTPLGLEDMAGNAAEWTADWYDATYYKRSEKRSPKGPRMSTGTRSIRGGSWADPPFRLRSTARAGADPNRGKDSLGFRCARDLK